jgi:hypothetical protein
MNLKLVTWPAVIIGIAALAACSSKTDYGEAQSQTSNAARQKAQQTVPQPPIAQQPTEVKIPDFLDQKASRIKDLPSYPGSGLVTISYGPLKGADQVSTVDMAAVTLQTRDPFQKVAEFYDKEVKKKGWQLKSDARNPEDLTLRLVKNEGKDEAIVEVRKEGDVVYINLRRFGNPRRG